MKVVTYNDNNVEYKFHEITAGGLFVVFDSARYEKGHVDDDYNIQLYHEYIDVATIRQEHCEEFEKQFLSVEGNAISEARLKRRGIS